MYPIHHRTCKILQSLAIFCRISNSQVYSTKQAPSSFLTVQSKTVLINNKTIGDNFLYQSQSSPRSAKTLITKKNIRKGEKQLQPEKKHERKMEQHALSIKQNIEGQIVIIPEEGRIKYERKDFHFIIKAHDMTTEVSDQHGSIKIMDNTKVYPIGNRKIIDPVRGWLLLYHNHREPREIIFRAMCPEVLQQHSRERKTKQSRNISISDTPTAPTRPARTCRRRLGYNTATNPDKEKHVAKPQNSKECELQPENTQIWHMVETLLELQHMDERVPRKIHGHHNTKLTWGGECQQDPPPPIATAQQSGAQ